METDRSGHTADCGLMVATHASHPQALPIITHIFFLRLDGSADVGTHTGAISCVISVSRIALAVVASTIFGIWACAEARILVGIANVDVKIVVVVDTKGTDASAKDAQQHERYRK